VILVDPYLSRIPMIERLSGAPPFARLPGDMRPGVRLDDIAVPDVATIDAHIKRADFILVTHTHLDHVLDVPHIALKTHATVIGTESTENVLRAHSVPEEQLVTVRGGEDYDFGSFSVMVIHSLHGARNHKHYFSSATAPAGLKAPLTARQMSPEGGTLAFLIRFQGHQILAFGTMNYIEREIAGLRPDVVLVGARPERNEVYDYTGRLLRALNFPAVVLPTHWDNFSVPYETSQQESLEELRSFVKEIKAASPKTEVIVPKYFEAIPLALAQNTRRETAESTAGAEQEVLALEEQWEALQRSDSAQRTTLWADDLVYIGNDGRTHDKPSLSRAVSAGEVKTESLEVTERKIRVYGDVAVVTALERKRASFHEKEPRDFEQRYTPVWARRNSMWQIVSFQATGVTSAAVQKDSHVQQ